MEKTKVKYYYKETEIDADSEKHIPLETIPEPGEIISPFLTTGEYEVLDLHSDRDGLHVFLKPHCQEAKRLISYLIY